jgi:hypothetical protein
MASDLSNPDNLWSAPLEARLEWCEQADTPNKYDRVYKLLKTLPSTSLQEINSAKWDSKLLCDMWEHMLDEGYESDNNLGIIQSLLKVENLSPRLRKHLEEAGLEIIPEKLKVEAHVPPNAINGNQFQSSIFVCDDYLSHVIRGGNPFKAIENGQVELNLDRYTPILPDSQYTRGKIGEVTINNKIHLAFAHHPIASSSADSRGIFMHDKLYAIGADPLHPAWIYGVDFNMDTVLNSFRRYLSEGIIPKIHG